MDPTTIATGGGLTGVLTLLIVSFIKGWIVVGTVHREQLADKDAQITRLWNAFDSLAEALRRYAVSAETSAYALHQVEKIAAEKGGDEP